MEGIEHYSQEDEGSNLSSRRTSFSQDGNDRSIKKLKLGRPKQSFVWTYFTTIDNINYCQVENVITKWKIVQLLQI